jgi:spermidine synthase
VWLVTTSRWLTEPVAPGVRLGYEVRQVLSQDRTEYQELVLIENERFGRMLMLEGVAQTTTADEFIYHEMLSHVPLLAFGRPADVLIVGGGDCGLAEEVLKHRTVRSVMQVEIDERVVEFSRRHLAEINAPVFDDSRFKLEIADGAVFMATTDRQFDIVLIDSTDPTGAARAIFAREFYEDVRRRLRPGGVLVVQAGVPFLQPLEFGSTICSHRRATTAVILRLVGRVRVFRRRM